VAVAEVAGAQRFLRSSGLRVIPPLLLEALVCTASIAAPATASTYAAAIRVGRTFCDRIWCSTIRLAS
jgi:hypothetical protein